MKKILLILLLIQGALVSSVIDSIKVKDVKIPVVFEEYSVLPIISIQFVFKASGSLQDGDKEGLARLSAKILNEGTKKLGSTGFATKLDNSAIGLSVGPGKETMVITISCLKEKLDSAIDLLVELLQDPNYTEDSLKKIKFLTIAALKKRETDFDYIASKNLKKLLYKGTPLALTSLGTKESLAKITLNDVKKYIEEHLVLKRAIVVGGGDMDLEKLKELSTKVFKNLKKGESKKIKLIKATEKSIEDIIYKDDIKQAYIYFGSKYNLKYSDEDVYKAKVANFILGGGGFGSRIMEEIRVKRGLAYSAYSSISMTKSNSHFTGYLQTKLESKDEAIKVVKEVIANFIKKGVTKEELEQSKKFLLGSEPLRNETLSQRVGRLFQEYYKGFKIGHTKEILKKIEKLKLKELNEFIKSHPEILNLSFSIVTKEVDDK